MGPNLLSKRLNHRDEFHVLVLAMTKQKYGNTCHSHLKVVFLVNTSPIAATPISPMLPPYMLE